MRRAGAAVSEEEAGKLASGGVDTGFQFHRLDSSSFKVWDGDSAPADSESLAEQLKVYADHIKPDRSELDILYELMLKAGLPLTTRVEQKQVTGRTVYVLASGTLVVCLEHEVDRELLRGIMEMGATPPSYEGEPYGPPAQVICLDQAFSGNDELKTNTVLEMLSHNITFRTV